LPFEFREVSHLIDGGMTVIACDLWQDLQEREGERKGGRERAPHLRENGLLATDLPLPGLGTSMGIPIWLSVGGAATDVSILLVACLVFTFFITISQLLRIILHSLYNPYSGRKGRPRQQ